MSNRPPKLMDPDALERQLRRDLEVLRQYREVLARYGGEAPNGAPAEASAAVQHPRQSDILLPRKRNDHSLVGAIEKHMTDVWQRAAFYEEKAREVRPTTTSGAVRSTLRRLMDAGIAEKRGTKASGVVEYRRKQG
jgi:hypothetical protein